jgi:hypothetical protein
MALDHFQIPLKQNKAKSKVVIDVAIYEIK